MGVLAFLNLVTPLNPLRGDGYQFWSGIAGDAFILTGGIVWWRKHNCAIHHCWRISFHPHPEHGLPVCKRHHPAHPVRTDDEARDA